MKINEELCEIRSEEQAMRQDFKQKGVQSSEKIFENQLSPTCHQGIYDEGELCAMDHSSQVMSRGRFIFQQ